MCVPGFIRTDTRKRGGRACSRRTRTARPMTVAREQWVIVGVRRMVSFVSLVSFVGVIGGRPVVGGGLVVVVGGCGLVVVGGLVVV